jgi:hypothetical protein
MWRSRSETKRIALVAHDNKKADLLEWARFNRDTLAAHHLYATGTTGTVIESELATSFHVGRCEIVLATEARRTVGSSRCFRAALHLPQSRVTSDARTGRE